MAKNVPDGEFLTLVEAVTLLAYDKAMNTAQCWTMVSEFERKQRDLMETCLQEANSDPGYSNFPRQFTGRNASKLVKELDECRNDWTPSTAEFYRWAYEASIADKKTDKQIQQAQKTLYRAAYVGAVVLHGRKEGGGPEQFEDIPAIYFRKPRIMMFPFDTLKSADKYETFCLPGWTEVHVKLDGFKELIERKNGDNGRKLSPGNLDAAPTTVKTQLTCQRWLEQMRREGPPTKTKNDYLAEYRRLENISQKQFLASWTSASAATVDSPYHQDWIKPGPKVF